MADTILGQEPTAPAQTDPGDMTDRYNTKLSPADEKAFEQFLAEHKDKTGRDLSKDLYDYDVRGWWKAGADSADNGHGPDTYKKPNHPTFSNESKYNGKDGNEGGKWSKVDGKDAFIPGPTNAKYWSPDALQDYFKRVEPDVTLLPPLGNAAIMGAP